MTSPPSGFYASGGPVTIEKKPDSLKPILFLSMTAECSNIEGRILQEEEA
jgi:hypothetical protein